jgi:hypothetical protein
MAAYALSVGQPPPKAVWWVGGYLGIMLLATFVSGWRVHGGSGVWTMGDWLINYSGGFVRRGLPGSIAIHLQQALHVRSTTIVIVFGMLLYGCLFACIRPLTANVRWNVFSVAAFVSPMTIASPFVSTSGYHKEVAFLAAFSVLLLRLLILRRDGKKMGWGESFVVAIVAVLGTLSHELFVIYFPYVVGALYIADPNWRRFLRISALPVVAVAITMSAVLAHPGTVLGSRQVCLSLGTENQGLCAGSINYLGHTPAEARAETSASVKEYFYLQFMPPLAVLGLLPIIASFWCLRGRSIEPNVWAALIACTAVSVLFSLSLFVYGADWGRWIEIHVFSLFLLMLFMTPLNRAPAGVRAQRTMWKIGGQVLLLSVYATCWSLPGTTNTPKAGYVSMFHRVGARLLR